MNEELENIVASNEILGLLKAQKKDNSTDTFEADLKNPETMSRQTYASLALLLIDDTARISAGLEPARLTWDQKTEIKRISRASEFLFLQGLGISKKRPLDENGKPIPYVQREQRPDQSSGKPGQHGQYVGNKHQGGYRKDGDKTSGGYKGQKTNARPQNLSVDATNAISKHDAHAVDERPARPTFSTERRVPVQNKEEQTMVDRIVEVLNINENISDAQRRANDQGCRTPSSMTKPTASALLNLRKKECKSHHMHSPFMVIEIDKLLGESSFTVSEDKSTIVTVSPQGE